MTDLPKPRRLSSSEQANGLNAIFSNGFPKQRTSRTKFLGFKIFYEHFGYHQLTSFLKESGIIGDYPLKVIHLVRHDFVLRSFSLFEAIESKTWVARSSVHIPRGALLNFNDSSTIYKINEQALVGCLFSSFYRSNLLSGEQVDLIQVLEVDSDDIVSTSPNFNNTYNKIRSFLSRDVDSTSLNSLSNFHPDKGHVIGRSSLPLLERIPNLNQVIGNLREEVLTHVVANSSLFTSSLVSACRKEIFSEYKHLLSDEFN